MSGHAARARSIVKSRWEEMIYRISYEDGWAAITETGASRTEYFRTEHSIERASWSRAVFTMASRRVGGRLNAAPGGLLRLGSFQRAGGPTWPPFVSVLPERP